MGTNANLKVLYLYSENVILSVFQKEMSTRNLGKETFILVKIPSDIF